MMKREKEELSVAKYPAREGIERITKKFVGNITQLTPRYSAAKISGQEAYKRARRGEEFSLPPRNVVIHEIEILEYDWPILNLRVTTGLGVYIRSLAREIGEGLGPGGYLANLVRTRVGEHVLERAITVEKLERMNC